MQEVKPELTNEQWEHANSRTLAIIDTESLRKLQSLSVLIIGLKGVGAEIAKNLILMGVQHVTLHDTNRVVWSDLSSNFFLQSQDVGHVRGECCLPRLQELNERSNVVLNNSPIDENLIKTHKVVVLTDILSREATIRVNNLCRACSTPERTICNIICGSVGAFGSIFVDFGSKFAVSDTNGEPLRSGFISDISQEKSAVVQLTKGEQHMFDQSDKVKITECTGQYEVLNGRVFDQEGIAPNKFKINFDTTNLGIFDGNGFWEQMKCEKLFDFDSLESFYGKELPFGKFLVMDDFFDRPQHIFLVLQGLQDFQIAYNRLPRPYDKDDEQLVFELIQKISDTLGSPEWWSAEAHPFASSLIKASAGDLCPLAMIIGGFVANQCITAISGKFSPLDQWLFLEATSSLPTKPLTAADVKLIGTRYDGQIAVYGNAFNEVISNLNYFQVGSGAIGCELLKNFALMGLSCGPKGKLFLTDMDTIEVSNLSRQFLFRTQHVGMHKSSVSSNAVRAVNPAMKIEALTKKVAYETENYFNDEFWAKLSGVANALDNFEARKYMDQQCLFYKKPMIDPATSGIQCELNITVPKITTSWSAGYQIPQEESFEICTIHNLPNKIVHTIHYARVAAFQKYFVEDPENLKKYLQMGPSCYDKLIGNLRNEFVLSLGRSLLKPPNSFEDCVEWAYRKWEEEFVYKAQRILDDYPLNSKLEDGSPYWVGSVRPPTPQVFDVNNPIHLEFIIAASYLRAYTMGIINDEHKSQDPEAWNQQREYIRKLVSTFKRIPYVSTTPSSGEVITKKKQQQQHQVTYTQEEISKIISDLPPPNAVKLVPNVCDFEKDDDTNFHIDCIYTWSSNRAQMYAIKLETRLRTKIICGNIIPAIITTTAFVAGFACLELIKQHQPGKKLEDFNNIMANLAGPMVQIFPPNEKKQSSAGKIGFNEWTRVDIPPSVVTFGDLDKWMQSYNIVINTIGVQGGLLWLGTRSEKELNRKIVDAYAEIFHQGTIPEYIYHFVMQIDAKDKKGKPLVDAETQTSLLPIICFWIKKSPVADFKGEGGKGKRKSAERESPLKVDEVSKKSKTSK